MSKTKYDFIPFLKTLAVLLVINSHLDAYYPISAMATGGALGNALFFILSGFCLSKPKGTFCVWYKYRVLKVYPQTVLMSVAMYLFYTLGVHNLQSAVLFIVWPTAFWFIGAIVLFYIPYYFIFENKEQLRRKFFIITIGIVILYFVGYLLLDTSIWVVENADIMKMHSYFRFIYYFYIFIMGGYIRHNIERLAYRPVINFVLTIGSVILLYGSKILMDAGILSYHMQFSNQLFVLIFAVCFLCMCLCLEMRRKTEMLTIPKGIDFLAKRSLYYYLAHMPLLRLEKLSSMRFPYNVLVFMIITIVLAEILYKVVGMLQKRHLVKEGN